MLTPTANTTANPARQAADVVGPSVVQVGGEHRGRHGGRGGGIVIEPGAIVTNAHDLRGAEITVTFADGRRETGTVAGHDIDGDLAVVKVDTGDSPVADWGGGADLGEPVFTVSRLGDGGVRVTAGTVSATGRSFRGPRGRQIRGSLEHTAPRGRGSSGSPIVDGDGRVVAAGGFDIASVDDLHEALDAVPPGESLALLTVRGTEELDVQVPFDPADSDGEGSAQAHDGRDPAHPRPARKQGSRRARREGCPDPTAA